MLRMKMVDMGSSRHTGVAVRRRYIQVLVPLLRKINGHAYSPGLTKGERGRMVRFAADMCLVNAAAGRAKWGEALRKNLIITAAAGGGVGRAGRRRKLRRKRSSSLIRRRSHAIKAKLPAARGRHNGPIDLTAHGAEAPARRPIATAGEMRNMEGLQRVIPGGTDLLDPATLLEETALYILALQMQVDALNTLASASSTNDTSTA